MNKLIALALAFLLVVPVVLAVSTLKPENIRFRTGGPQRYNDYFYDPRVQYQKLDTIVYLTPPEPPVFSRGYPPIYARGTAKMQSVRSAYKPTGQVILQVKDVRPSSYDSTVYQAWLQDADTGYMLNLGQFEAVGGGAGEINYIGSQYFDAYEFVVVTREKRDNDPRPSDDVVLIGKITKRNYHQPIPLLGAKAQYGYTYYGE